MPSLTPRKFVQISLEWHLPAALGSILAAVTMTWPLAAHAHDHLLAAAYYWDAYTNTMIMGGHVDAVVGRGPLSLYDNYFFAPLPHSVAFNENLFGLSLLFAPFYLLGDNPDEANDSRIWGALPDAEIVGRFPSRPSVPTRGVAWFGFAIVNVVILFIAFRWLLARLGRRTEGENSLTGKGRVGEGDRTNSHHKDAVRRSV